MGDGAARVDGGPVDVRALDPQFGGTGDEAGVLVLVTAESADDGDRLLGRLRDGLHAHGQHGVGADLDQAEVALAQGLLDRLGEADGPAQTLVPVRGVHRGRVQRLTGDRGDQRNPGHPRRHRSEDVQQLRLDVLHLRRVRGVIHRHPTGPNTSRLRLSANLLQSLRVTGHNRGVRTVVHGHRHPVPVRIDPPRCLLGARRQRQHPTATGEFIPNGSRPESNDPSRVLQTQRTCHRRSRDLPLRVTDDGRRGHPEGLPHRGKGDHHGPQHGLDHIHPPHPGVVIALQHLDK